MTAITETPIRTALTATTDTSTAAGRMPVEVQAILRLQSWLSPGFPVGAYAYSHGLEYAVEAGLVTDAGTLGEWLEADLRAGTGWTDAVLLVHVYRNASSRNVSAVVELAELAAALRGSSELGLESTAQGEAFLAMLATAWPTQRLDELTAPLARAEVSAAYPVAVALGCAAHGIPLRPALPLFLQARLANLISAGIRLAPLGQCDGQRIASQLEGAVAAVSATALSSSLDDLGSAALMVEWSSMRHETQYTRLFRS